MVIDRRLTDEANAGFVYRQSPKAGEPIKRNTRATVFVSAGEPALEATLASLDDDLTKKIRRAETPLMQRIDEMVARLEAKVKREMEMALREANEPYRQRDSSDDNSDRNA
jgi:hypothetical protein